MFFINFAFVLQHGNMCFKIGVEVMGQVWGENVVNCYYYSDDSKDESGCTIYYTHCGYSECDNGQSDSYCRSWSETDYSCLECPQGYCDICGQCLSICGGNHCVLCPICGQCGCEGGCQIPDDPGNPNACNEIDNAVNDLMQAYSDYSNDVENYQTNLDMLNQTTNDYLSVYNNSGGLIDEYMNQYQDAITEYENNVAVYQNMISDHQNNYSYLNDSQQKLTAAEFEYSVNGTISADPLSYYNFTMNNFSNYLNNRSDYNSTLNNIKYSVDGIKSYNDRTQYKDSVAAYKTLLTSRLLVNQAFVDSVSLLHQQLFGTVNSGTALTVQQKYDHLMQHKNTMQSFVTFVDSIVSVIRQTTPDYLKNITDNQEYIKKAMLDRPEILAKATQQYSLLFGGYSVSATYTTAETKALQWVNSYAQNQQYANYYAAKCRYVALTETATFSPYVNYFAGQLSNQLASYAQIKGTWNNYLSGNLLAFLGKSGESELSGAKNFYIELDNLVNFYQPDNSVPYNTRLYQVLEYYNPTDEYKQALKYYLADKLANEQTVTQGMEQIKQQAKKVSDSEAWAKNCEHLLSAQQQAMIDLMTLSYRNTKDMYDLTKNIYDQNIQSSQIRFNQALQRYNNIIAQYAKDCANAQTPPSTNVPNTTAPENKLEGKTPKIDVTNWKNRTEVTSGWGWRNEKTTAYLNDDECEAFFKDAANGFRSLNDRISDFGYGAGLLTSAIKRLGSFWTTLITTSYLYGIQNVIGSIELDFRQLGSNYMHLENANGLFVITSTNSIFSNGMATTVTISNFYLSDGSLFFTIYY